MSDIDTRFDDGEGDCIVCGLNLELDGGKHECPAGFESSRKLYLAGLNRRAPNPLAGVLRDCMNSLNLLIDRYCFEFPGINAMSLFDDAREAVAKARAALDAEKERS